MSHFNVFINLQKTISGFASGRIPELKVQLIIIY